MKRPIALLLISCLTMLGIHAQTDSLSKYQLLWEITSPKTQLPSYLFGTMHVTDGRAFQMPDSVLLAITNTQGFALEVDFDSASYLFLEYLYAARGQQIFDVTSWQAAEENTKSWDGDADADVDLDPAELFKLFDRNTVHEDEATFLDAFLYRLARQQNKVICGLENIVSQLEMIAKPDMMINAESSGSKPKGPRKRLRLNDMIEAYSVGDLEQIHLMANQGGTSQFFKNDVIIKRNYGMAERADSLMHLRPTFVGVGAAHLLGDEGVLALLRQRGYRTRPVVATYTQALATAARERPYEPHWTTFQKLGDGYRLKVPARPFPIDMLGGKVKMHLGMDFAGGLVYCFYALTLPGELTDDKIAEIGKSVLKSFGTDDEQTGNDITYLGLKGKEIRVKKHGEDLRIRLLFNHGKMYMLLLGNSKKVIDSPVADEWFNSLEFFEPVPLAQQPRQRLRDPINGFSIMFPEGYDYERHQVSSFPTGGTELLYNQYVLQDQQHQEAIKILSQDFQDPIYAGALRELMPACINFLSGAELEPEGEYETLLLDGVSGLGASYQGESLRYRLHCFMRHNRLYVAGFAFLPTDADSTVLESILNSLHFLPAKPLILDTPYRVEGSWEAMLPLKPVVWEMEDLPETYAGRIDSVRVYYAHDPVSSYNSSIEYAHVWKYYAGGNAELFEAIVTATDADSTAHIVMPPADLPQRERDGRAYYNRFDSASGLHLHMICIPSGNDILIGRLQLPNNADVPALIARFDAQLQSIAPPLAEANRPEQLLKILNNSVSSDQKTADEAKAGMRFYRLQPTEYESAITNFKAERDDEPYGTDAQLLEILLEVDDPNLLPQLQALYKELPSDDAHRSNIMLSLLKRDWPGAEAWALDQLKSDPSVLDHASDYFSWSSYLQDDSTGSHMRNLEFLLDIPAYALGLAADASSAAYDAVDYHGYDARFMQIFDAAITNRPAVEANYMYDLNLYQLLSYLSDENVTGWQASAHRMIALRDGYLPGSAFTTLASLDAIPSDKEMKHVLSMRDSRDYALAWLLDSGNGEAIPPKYRKPAYIAAVSLDLALEDHPAHVERIEQQKIYFDGREQWLFTYRFAQEGERDWTLGFGGPIPLHGLPETAYLQLSGSEYEAYSPATYKRKVKSWIRDRREN